jgi:chloramphenicol 3-O phosphotransferase
MKKGTVIFINGTSSSGKTCIVHALQDLLDQPFLEAGIDKFIWSMPSRYLNRPLWDDILGRADQAGEAGLNLVRGMHRAIQALSNSGCNVIADHVLIESAWVNDCVRLFFSLPAYLIGMQCPLEILENRERSRKNRILGQARKQFPLIHKDLLYDLEVDTSQLSPQECALNIKSRLNEMPRAFHQMRQMI